MTASIGLINAKVGLQGHRQRVDHVSTTGLFLGAKLNFAENLLYPACAPPEKSLAVIAATETSMEKVTWAELRERVRVCINAMRCLGIGQGDRVAGYLAHHTNALVVMLAATSLGAIWTGVSPDMGVHAVLDRFEQIHPLILFADNAVFYNGKVHEVSDKVVEIVEKLPQLKALVVFETIPNHPLDTSQIKLANGQAWLYADFLSSAPQSAPISFAHLPADTPIYILYSSGTTGKPKCIIHGAIGTLLMHKKEHSIQYDIQPGDRLFYYTTTAWMMWHWQVSALSSGATLILYSGSPFAPFDASGTGDLAMPRLIDSLRVTHFGTSAKYLSLLEQRDILPRRHCLPMHALKAIYSTGSPLAPSTFAYAYRAFGPDLHLASISGGTDVVSAFLGGNLLGPVVSGEIQARGLGFAIEAWDVHGADASARDEPGDLVITRPFPCQPLGFWDDDNDDNGKEGGQRYRATYFERFEGVWHHGDFVRINPRTGGLVMLGRSDGVLKPAGVRFGSAEIYNVVLKWFAEAVEDALCVGRRRATDADETVVLFLKMAKGVVGVADLAERVKKVIRSELSPRHVPAIVDACPEIPVTTNGKK